PDSSVPTTETADETADGETTSPGNGTGPSDVTGPSSDDTANGTHSPEETGEDTGSEDATQPLTPTTFVFERKVGDGNDHVVAMSCVSGAERIITTLAEGSVEGWNVDGISVSPDRTRLVLASRYGATAADVATGL